jgi:hypothetical protein
VGEKIAACAQAVKKSTRVKSKAANDTPAGRQKKLSTKNEILTQQYKIEHESRKHGSNRKMSSTKQDLKWNDFFIVI